VPPDFETIYRNEISYVWDFLRYVGIPAKDLEDVAHDVFVVVHRHFSEYDSHRPIRPWLTGIAFRVASDYRRRAHTYREVFSEEVHAAAPGPNAETRLSHKQAYELLLKALDRLSPERRAVFVLHEIEEVALTEIAVILTVPVNTIYSRLRRARKQFAAALERLERRGGAR